MKKTVLTFGLISGAISAAGMLATLPFADKIGWDKGAVVGSAESSPRPQARQAGAHSSLGDTPGHEP